MIVSWPRLDYAVIVLQHSNILRKGVWYFGASLLGLHALVVFGRTAVSWWTVVGLLILCTTTVELCWHRTWEARHGVGLQAVWLTAAATVHAHRCIVCLHTCFSLRLSVTKHSGNAFKPSLPMVMVLLVLLDACAIPSAWHCCIQQE